MYLNGVNEASIIAALLTFGKAISQSYMSVRAEIEKVEIEQEFFTDVIETSMSKLQGYYYGWPTPRILGAEISKWQAKLSVGFIELNNTGLFRSPDSIGRFLIRYGTYDFLTPVPVTKYGVEPIYMEEWLRSGLSGSSEPSSMLIRLGKVLESKVNSAAGQKDMKLREIMDNALSVVAKRRRERTNAESARHSPQSMHSAASQQHSPWKDSIVMTGLRASEFEPEVCYISSSQALTRGPSPPAELASMHVIKPSLAPLGERGMYGLA